MSMIGKTCPGCNTRKPLNEYGNDSAKASGKAARCLACVRTEDRDRHRTGEATRTIRQRAFNRAMAQLRDVHRPEFERLYAAALAAAKAEAAEHVAAAKVADPDVTPDPHRPIPLLMPGVSRIGQTEPRLREDVGGCPLCVNRHDRGHVCPSCGARPQVSGPVVPAQFRLHAADRVR